MYVYIFGIYFFTKKDGIQEPQVISLEQPWLTDILETLVKLKSAFSVSHTDAVPDRPQNPITKP